MNKLAQQKVLIIDDDEKCLSSLRRILRSICQVVTTKDPLKAIEIFKYNGPFAVVISDYRMPQLSGIALFSRIFSLNRNAHRIILTGHAELQMAIDAINEGKITAFLTKPVSAAAIRSAVFEAIRTYTQTQIKSIRQTGTQPPATQNVSEMNIPLTIKEKSVLTLLAKGYSNEEISQEMHITIGTVKSHINNLFGKMEVNSRSKIVAKALKFGLIPL